MRYGRKIRGEWSQEFAHQRDELPAYLSAAWSSLDQGVGGCRTHRNTSFWGKASEGAADHTCPHHYLETPPLQAPFSLIGRECQLQLRCAGAETFSPARARYAAAHPSRERGMQVMNPSVCTSGEQTANSVCAAGAPVANLSPRVPSAQASAALHQASSFPSDSFLQTPFLQTPTPQPGPHLLGGGQLQHSPATASEAKLGCLVDLPVDKQHHAKRQVEGSAGGEDGVGGFLAYLSALELSVIGLFPAKEQRSQGDECRVHPGECYQERRGAAAHRSQAGKNEASEQSAGPGGGSVYNLFTIPLPTPSYPFLHFQPRPASPWLTFPDYIHVFQIFISKLRLELFFVVDLWAKVETN